MVSGAQQEVREYRPAARTSGPGHGLRVLVVDDDDSARIGLLRLFEGEGFVVEAASDGWQALDLARGMRPDVVLTDVQMPVMDGIELCRRVRELDPTTPVLVMTALGAIPDAVAAMRAGAVDYLTKPLDMDAVLLGVRAAVENRAVYIERDHLQAQQQALLEDARGTIQAHERVNSIVAHDLRSPVQIVGLQARILAQANHELPLERLRHIGERLLRATTRMDRLLADLLDESRIRTGHLTIERKPVRVRDVLSDMAELRPLAWQSGVALSVDMRATDRTFIGDRARIGQVFTNLLSNAIKFSAPGGSVTASAQESIAGLCFSVSDEGPGIAEADRARLFEPFWQGDGQSRSGVGLGLYIAKTIVVAHGGSISVDSEPGRGATFRVLFPVEMNECADPGRPG